jgi:predicted Rossmann-fold nucleotide-binding protein
MADGYVACKGGTGTLVELAVVWEMLNKRAMQAKPFAALGGFWLPIIERVREVECGSPSSEVSKWGEAGTRLIYSAKSPEEAAGYLSARLQ